MSSRAALIFYQRTFLIVVEWSSGAVARTVLRPLTVSPLSGECPGRADLRPVSTAPSSNRT